MEIGVDIIEIKRIKRAVKNENFIRKIFTKEEINSIKQKKGEILCRYVAGRFAAKEAVSKVLGTGIGYVRWKDIEILSDESGKPTVRLSGRALELAESRGFTRLLISISHCGDYAVAFSMAEGGVKGEGSKSFDDEADR
ncbi:holo-ACP synthase [Thermovorax subterraneus]|nr:holo-ACP synthase [Thermovorax subterraneus]